jgi:hypothetical protein
MMEVNSILALNTKQLKVEGTNPLTSAAHERVIDQLTHCR